MSLGERKEQENCVRRMCMPCNPPRILLGRSSGVFRGGGGGYVAHVAVKRSACRALVAKHEETGSSEDSGVDRKKLLK